MDRKKLAMARFVFSQIVGSQPDTEGDIGKRAVVSGKDKAGATVILSVSDDITRFDCTTDDLGHHIKTVMSKMTPSLEKI